LIRDRAYYEATCAVWHGISSIATVATAAAVEPVKFSGSSLEKIDMFRKSGEMTLNDFW
jgi:hypothetical protein